MSKKILIIEGAVILALVALNWFGGGISGQKAASGEEGNIVPPNGVANNSVKLERPAFLGGLNE